MDIQLLYWHWLVIGMILVVGEIFIPSFTILWFGLGALVGRFGGDVDTHVTKYSNSGLDGILSIIYCGLV
jgi:membrane protein implicated in regulation of membrane protease activity